MASVRFIVNMDTRPKPVVAMARFLTFGRPTEAPKSGTARTNAKLSVGYGLRPPLEIENIFSTQYFLEGFSKKKI